MTITADQFRELLSAAIHEVISIFGDANVEAGELDRLNLAENVRAEMRLGVSIIPVAILPEDIAAYVCALLATKAIAVSRTNADREGALRLLYTAAHEVASRRFDECIDSLITCNAGRELQPWPEISELPPAISPDVASLQPQC